MSPSRKLANMEDGLVRTDFDFTDNILENALTPCLVQHVMLQIEVLTI
jgi:hypothetical protein